MITLGATLNKNTKEERGVKERQRKPQNTKHRVAKRTERDCSRIRLKLNLMADDDDDPNA